MASLAETFFWQFSPLAADTELGFRVSAVRQCRAMPNASISILQFTWLHENAPSLLLGRDKKFFSP